MSHDSEAVETMENRERTQRMKEEDGSGSFSRVVATSVPVRTGYCCWPREHAVESHPPQRYKATQTETK